MLTAAKMACLLLLFLLFYMAVNHGLHRLFRRKRALSNLKRSGGRPLSARFPGASRYMAAFSVHLADLLRSARIRLDQGPFLLLSCALGTAGVTAGLLYFASLKGVVALGLMLLIAPYIWLRSRLIALQLKHRIDFLPAVESFYQLYVLSETRNIRAVLRAALDGQRLPHSVGPVFEQLYLGLMMQRNTEDCLRAFALALGGRWAGHLAAMLRFALEDGADISTGMRELIADMRRAIRTDHADRNRLLEIRIANFTPLLFLAVFLLVNVHIDSEQAYRYYVEAEAGRSMLLDALLLIGASFVMGLYLSMRKI